MASLEQWREIVAAANFLPDEKLLKVLELVEQAPDRDRAGEFRQKVRSRLVQLRPPRRITAQRLLFNPVEDLFDPPDHTVFRHGRISRAVIAPCWQIIAAGVTANLITLTESRLRSIGRFDLEAQNEVGVPLWSAAAGVLGQRLADAARDTKIRIELFGRDEGVVRQVEMILRVLEIGAEIEDAKINLPPKPIFDLTDIEAELLGQMISPLAKMSMDRVRWFLRAIMARMANPGELLKVLSGAALNCSKAERDALIRDLGGTAVAAMASETEHLVKGSQERVDPAAATTEVERLVDGLSALETSMGRLVDRTLLAEIRSTRGEIGKLIMGKIMPSADAKLLAALPTPGRHKKIGTPAEEEKELQQAEEAEGCALALRRCARVAGAVGLQSQIDAKVKSLCTEIEKRGSQAGLTGEDNDVYAAVRMMELLSGPEEAERMLRRVRAG
ncbi:conserved hypothetical protein [uncultured Gammaproteobacteria bacterium]